MSEGELTVSPPALPAVRLPSSPTEHFYDWERLGRGWRLWEHPAYLEPPFRPFFHLPLQQLMPPPIDDGRRPTFMSRLVDKLRGVPQAAPIPAPLIDPETLRALLEDPEIPPYEETEGLIELQVILPLAAKVTNDTFGSFLIALAFCSSPLSFEVIGTAKEIVVQIVARERDAEEVTEQLRAHFPEVTIRAVTKHLHNLWLEDVELPALVVDFGLSHEFMRPLQTLSSGADPLVAITGALAKLREGEIGILQVQFESVQNPWAESIFRAVTDHEGKTFFANAPEMVGLAKEKIRSPLFAAVIRVAAKSEDEDRALRIARSLGGALAALDNPNVNDLFPLNNEGYDDVQHEVDMICRQSRRSGMLLNLDELVSLVHLPTVAVRSPKLKRQSEKTKRAPAVTTGHRTLLGVNDFEDEAFTVTLSTDQRVKHMHVIGAPGTGKSTFLQNLVLQDIEQGHGVAVLDPHGDLIDQILERVKEERREDVILFDPSDEEFPIGFNILSAHSEIEKNLLSSDLVGVFRRLSTSWGDQMTSVLGNAILAMLESEQGGTLADLRRFLIEKSFREDFLKTVKDQQVAYYWKKEFPLLTGGKSLGPLLTRLDTFLRPKLIRHMVAQRENKLDFRTIMDGNKIFLAKLSQGAIGEENAWLLGSLLVAKFHQIALARQDMREAERKPFFLYADEFHNFITPSMTQILSGARKYRLGLILAHQELRQLGGAGSEIGSSVLSNPYTRVCFRLGDDDARKIEGGFSFFEAKDFQNLGTGEAIARVERADFDFNLATAPLPPVDADAGRANAEEIRQLSREKYGTPRERVEAELARLAGVGEEHETAEKPKRSAAKKVDASATDKTSPANDAATTAVPVPDQPDSTQSEPPPPSQMPTREAESNPLSFSEAIRAREVVTPESEPPPAVPESFQSPALPPSPGRGGTDHKALQKQIALWAQGMGWRAEIEKEISGGAGSVDVALEQGGISVACEISMTTGVEQETGNIEKCLRARFTHTLMIAKDQKHLSKIRRAAAEKLGEEALASVRFVRPQEFFAFMEELAAQSAATQDTLLGLKVNFNYRHPGATQPGARPARKIAERVAKAIGKSKGEKDSA